MNKSLAHSIVQAHRKGRPINAKYSLAIAVWWAYASYAGGSLAHKAAERGDTIAFLVAAVAVVAFLVAFTIALRSAGTTKDRQRMFDLSHNIICNALDVVELEDDTADQVREARRA